MVESPSQTSFQTSGACCGVNLGCGHCHEYCPFQSAWACWRACWDVAQLAGRAWWWSAGCLCCWWASLVTRSSQDPKSCGFYGLSKARKEKKVQSMTIILAFSTWEMTQLTINNIFFQLKQQCDDTSVQAELAYWIYYTCCCGCFLTLHLPSLQLKMLSLNIS